MTATAETTAKTETTTNPTTAISITTEETATMTTIKPTTALVNSGFDLLSLIQYWIGLITHVINIVMMILEHIPVLHNVFRVA